MKIIVGKDHCLYPCSIYSRLHLISVHKSIYLLSDFAPLRPADSALQVRHISLFKSPVHATVQSELASSLKAALARAQDDAYASHPLRRLACRLWAGQCPALLSVALRDAGLKKLLVFSPSLVLKAGS